MTYQLVKHIPSGEVYAVQFDSDKVYLTEALHHTEQEADFEDYEYGNEETEWFSAQEWQVIREA